MKSTATELVRRMLPAVLYSAREAGDPRLDAATRAVLGALASDLVVMAEAALDALAPDDREEATVRDLERARRRLRTARQLGEVA